MKPYPSTPKCTSIKALLNRANGGKVFFFLLLMVFAQVHAQGNTQGIINPVVSLSLKNASIEKVFKEITKQSGYQFVYNNSLLKSSKRVNIQSKNKSVKQVLAECFAGQPLTFQIIDQTIIVKPVPQVFVQQTVEEEKPVDKEIQGRVTNEDGEALSSASVTIKGTQTAVKTNENGEFTISSSSDEIILIVSMVGYIQREIAVKDNSYITVVLRIDQRKMSDIVVTGIYNRDVNTYTGSVITITKDEIKRTGSVNFFQSLKNIAPSMVLDNFVDGSNPNVLPDVRIRGTSSLPVSESDFPGNLKGNYLKNPNVPLFILDGFETNMETVFDLDMNRIESVTILKDASSKALYGSKAANGVIVIETTKVNAYKPLVTYNASVDIELPDLTSYNLTNALEKLEAERIDGMYIASPTTYDPPALNAELLQLYNYRKKLAMEGLNTYWLAKPLRNGIGQKHSLTAELGGDNLRIIGEVGYRDVKGVMKGSSRQNIYGSLGTSYRVKKLLFRNITTITSNQSKESPYGTFNDYARMNPYWIAENIDGTIPYYSELGPNGVKYTNPLFNSTVNSKDVSEYLNVINNFYLEWHINPFLRATTRIGIDLKRSSADEFYPSNHTKFESYVSEEAKQQRGSYEVNNGKSKKLSGDINLSYSKEINKNAIFGNIGYNVSERSYSEVIHHVEGFPSDRMTNIIFGRDYAQGKRPEGVAGEEREMGFLGAASYTYDGRFLSDLTLRTSASSLFGANRRWATFWSFGLGWNLHKETLFKNIHSLRLLKLRGSIGSTGNQNFNTNNSIATYEYYLSGLYQGFPGSFLTSMANPDLQWQQKFDYNAGLDAQWKGLTLRFDYYESYTENFLTDVTLPYSTGFASVKDNLGKVKNSGIEAYASYLIWAHNRNFISVNFSIETNTNKIVSLSNSMKAYNEQMDKIAGDQANNKPISKYQDGMSMDAIWAVPSQGIDPATGNEVYIDRNGNTTYIWNAGDMIVAGNNLSKYQGIFGVNGEYKNFGLSITGRYLGGGQLYNQTLADRVENVDMNYNVDKRVLTGRWTHPGQVAQYKRLGQFSRQIGNENVYESVDEKTRPTTRFVQDRNELTIGAINVYYDFTEMISSKSIQRLRASFNMNEIATFSSIRLERGLSYPFSRTMSFSILATF